MYKMIGCGDVQAAESTSSHIQSLSSIPFLCITKPFLSENSYWGNVKEINERARADGAKPTLWPRTNRGADIHIIQLAVLKANRMLEAYRVHRLNPERIHPQRSTNHSIFDLQTSSNH